MFDETAMAGLPGLDDAMNGTPDGLGEPAAMAPTPRQAPPAAYPNYTLPGMPQQFPQTMQGYPGHPGPMAGQTFQWLEPQGVDQSSVLRSAGVSALFLAGAFGLGVAVGGPWGAAAGVMLAGATMNAYRAQKWWGDADPSRNFEATSSAVFGAGGLLIGGYAAYQAYQAKLKKTGGV